MKYRSAKIQSVLEQELATAIHKILSGDEGNVSISHIQVQSDLKLVKIWLSVESTGAKRALIDRINYHRPALQQQISRRHHFRHTPVFSFEIDRPWSKNDSTNDFFNNQ